MTVGISNNKSVTNVLKMLLNGKISQLARSLKLFFLGNYIKNKYATMNTFTSKCLACGDDHCREKDNLLCNLCKNNDYEL